MKRHATFVSCPLLLWLMCWWPTAADAAPMFARKYQTTCQTCHVVPPALNPFGQAFRRNGYRMPDGGEEVARKEEPVTLGQEAHAELFPNAVWPGDLPATAPLSIVMQGGFVLSEGLGEAHGHGSTPAIAPEEAGHDAHEGADAKWGGQLGLGEVALVWGATLGETLSTFGKVAVTAGDHGGTVMVERPHLVYTPLGARLGLKLGIFDPGLTPSLSMHRNVNGHDLRFTSVSLGDNAWAPEPEQMGMELFGVSAFGRLGYTVGVVEGGGNETNRAKDFYGRLEYKLGGMALDGVGGTTESKPWAEWSVALGLFGYKGFATFLDPTGGTERQSDAFLRTGGDVDVHLGDVQLMLAGYHQADERPVFGNADPGSLQAGIAQFQYVVLPWLTPSIRYELFRQFLPSVEETEMAHHVLVSVNALARANLYVRLQGRLTAVRGASLTPQDFTLFGGWAL